MKILHIIGQLGIGGGEKQLYELIVNSSDKIEHEVMYFADSLDNEAFNLYDKANIKYSRIPRNKKKPFKFLKVFSKAITDCNPDIVHCWLYSANIWGRLAAIIAGHDKIIVAYRGGHLAYPLFMRCLEFFTANKVYHLANSRACANMTAKKTGIDPAKYDVIYNGVDTEKFNAQPVREQLKKQCNIPDDAKIVTMVGRLTASKNYPMLLRLAQKAQQENLNCHFLIVGYGREESELKLLAANLDVNRIVHFLGLRTDVPAILKSSDIFCYTTLLEGFPNALLEAMTAGLPIITTDFDGVNELITDNSDGIIIPLCDINTAFCVLKNFLDNSEKAILLGSNARKKAFNVFGVNSMVSKTINYYSKILAI